MTRRPRLRIFCIVLPAGIAPGAGRLAGGRRLAVGSVHGAVAAPLGAGGILAGSSTPAGRGGPPSAGADGDPVLEQPASSATRAAATAPVLSLIGTPQSVAADRGRG